MVEVLYFQNIQTMKKHQLLYQNCNCWVDETDDRISKVSIMVVIRTKNQAKLTVCRVLYPYFLHVFCALSS